MYICIHNDRETLDANDDSKHLLGKISTRYYARLGAEPIKYSPARITSETN